MDFQGPGTQLSSPTRLTLDEGDNDPLGWADNKTLVFVSDHNGHPRLFRQRTGENTARPLSSLLEDAALDAHISPDGAWICYRVDRVGDWRAGTARPVDRMRVRVTGTEKQFVLRSTSEADPEVRCAPSPSTICVIAEKAPDHNQMILTGVDPVRGRGREVDF